MHSVYDNGNLDIYETEELRVKVARVQFLSGSLGYKVQIYDYLFSPAQLRLLAKVIQNYLNTVQVSI